LTSGAAYLEDSVVVEGSGAVNRGQDGWEQDHCYEGEADQESDHW
jgi:hypothetical protein